jgi:putative MATE family efflux protein
VTTPFRNPHDREILRLALPALVTLAAEPLYILADTAVVGRLGTEALAGLAVASAILLIGYSLFIFLAYGTTASVARLLGAGDERQAAHQAVQGMWLAVLVGAVLIVLGLAFASPLVGLLGAEGAVRVNALVYLRISLLGVPAMLLVFAGSGYLRGLQDTRTPMVVALASAAFNLALEVVLIFGLDFGIGASALSTVVAQWGAAVVYVLWVRRAVRRHEVALGPDAATLGRLTIVGRDLFIRTAALRAAFLVSTAVAARIGVVDVAAHQITFEIWSFLALTLDAVAIAGQALIGRYLGAEDVEGARAAGRRMLWWGLWAGCALGALVLVARPVLPDVFTNDPLVAELVAFLLVFVAVTQPMNGVVFVLDGLLIGAGDMRFLAWAMVVALAVFAPCAWLVLEEGGGIGWLWAALGLFMFLRWVTLQARWISDAWAEPGPIRTSWRRTAAGPRGRPARPGRPRPGRAR